MSTERVILSFKDCRTREEAVAKYRVWLDEHCDGLVRAHAATLLAANDNCKDITSQTTQLRGEMARQRADLLARFGEILDEAGRGGGGVATRALCRRCADRAQQERTVEECRQIRRRTQ